MQNKLIISDIPQTLNLRENITGSQPQEETTATISCDAVAIYVDFCAISNKNAFISRGLAFNDKLWEGDIVEILLTLDNPNRYLEVEVNPNGVQYAVLVDNKDGLGDFKLTFLNSAPYISCVSVKNEHWTTHITLSFASLAKIGYNRANANINLYRQSYDAANNLRLYALSPTLKNSFHIPSAFIPLEIKELL